MTLKAYYPLLLFGLSLLSACKKQSAETESKLSAKELITNPYDSTDNTKAPVIAFSYTKYDFGKIITGDKVNHTFRFKNIGKSPLIIESAVSSCGCTVPQFSNKPVAPGDSGTVQVQFDSNGKLGQQTRTVTLVTNTNPSRIMLTLNGNVVEYQ